VLKATLLPPEYQQASVATLRWKLYRLAGKLVRHATVLVVKGPYGGREVGAARGRTPEVL